MDEAALALDWVASQLGTSYVLQLTPALKLIVEYSAFGGKLPMSAIVFGRRLPVGFASAEAAKSVAVQTARAHLRAALAKLEGEQS